MAASAPGRAAILDLVHGGLLPSRVHSISAETVGAGKTVLRLGCAGWAAAGSVDTDLNILRRLELDLAVISVTAARSIAAHASHCGRCPLRPKTRLQGARQSSLATPSAAARGGHDHWRDSPVAGSVASQSARCRLAVVPSDHTGRSYWPGRTCAWASARSFRRASLPDSSPGRHGCLDYSCLRLRWRHVSRRRSARPRRA